MIIGITRFHHMGDWMHTVCSGVGNYFVASVLWDLLNDCPRIVGTKAQRMDQIWSCIQYCYTKHPGIENKLNMLTIKMIGGKGSGSTSTFPELHCSAAEVS